MSESKLSRNFLFPWFGRFPRKMWKDDQNQNILSNFSLSKKGFKKSSSKDSKNTGKGGQGHLNFSKQEEILFQWWFSLVSLFLQIFRTPSLPNRKSKGADILREGAPPPTCHVSHVTCHVSCIMCHVSWVACHLSHIKDKSRIRETSNLLTDANNSTDSFFCFGVNKLANGKYWNKY